MYYVIGVHKSDKEKNQVVLARKQAKPKRDIIRQLFPNYKSFKVIYGNPVY